MIDLQFQQYKTIYIIKSLLIDTRFENHRLALIANSLD